MITSAPGFLRCEKGEKNGKYQQQCIEDDIKAKYFPYAATIHRSLTRRTRAYVISSQFGIVRESVCDAHDVKQKGKKQCKRQRWLRPNLVEIGASEHCNKENHKCRLIFSQTFIKQKERIVAACCGSAFNDVINNCRGDSTNDGSRQHNEPQQSPVLIRFCGSRNNNSDEVHGTTLITNRESVLLLSWPEHKDSQPTECEFRSKQKIPYSQIWLNFSSGCDSPTNTDQRPQFLRQNRPGFSPINNNGWLWNRGSQIELFRLMRRRSNSGRWRWHGLIPPRGQLKHNTPIDAYASKRSIFRVIVRLRS